MWIFSTPWCSGNLWMDIFQHFLTCYRPNNESLIKEKEKRYGDINPEWKIVLWTTLFLCSRNNMFNFLTIANGIIFKVQAAFEKKPDMQLRVTKSISLGFLQSLYCITVYLLIFCVNLSFTSVYFYKGISNNN